MSDLTATNCGCASNNACCNRSGFFGGSCIWIIILLVFFCNGNGCGSGMNGIFGRCGDDCDNNNCCEWLIWILILSCFCGNGCGNSCC